MLIVFGVGLSSYRNIQSLREDARWVEHTREVITLSNHILSEVLNVESAQRGYVATGDGKFLDQYNLSQGTVVPAINQLHQLTIDNPVQTARIDSLMTYASAKLMFAKDAIETRRTKGFEESRGLLLGRQGLDYMNDIRMSVNTIIGEETKLLVIREQTAAESSGRATFTIFIGSALVLVIVLFLFFFIQRTFQKQKAAEERVLENNVKLEEVSAENERKNWMLTGSGIVNENMRGEISVNELCTRVISALARYTGAQLGAIYIADDHGNLKLEASYAYDTRRGNRSHIKSGEGLLGQAAFEKRTIVFTDVPKDYVHLSSGLGEALPSSVIIAPCMNDHRLVAAIELGFAGNIGRQQREFLDSITTNISSYLQERVISTFFQRDFQANQLVANSILVDMEPKVV